MEQKKLKAYFSLAAEFNLEQKLRSDVSGVEEPKCPSF
jgi:hypothetical protein